jgi:predicted nucleic acid-binding protein
MQRQKQPLLTQRLLYCYFYFNPGMRVIRPRIGGSTGTPARARKIEVLGFDGPTDDMQKLEGLLSLADLLYIDDDVIQKTITIRKTKKMKLGDAIIAATAIIYGLTLISRNISDFKSIPGLTVIDPHTLA